MYGKRGKIGLIVPPMNTVIESEFNRMIPEGVSVHSARPDYEDPKATPEAIIRMSEDVVTAAQRVGKAEVDVIAWGCTSGSFLKGVGFDKELIKGIEEATGITGLTTSTAVIEALSELNFKKVAVATPYIDSINKGLQVFLEGNGLEVANMKGLQIIEAGKIGRQEPSVAYNIAKDVDTPEADGVFISCTDFRTIDILQKLEDELGKPVTSSNQATLWAALNRIGVSDPIKGYGSLLARK